MLLNEHLSKMLFQEAGIAVPQGIAFTPDTVRGSRPGFPLPWYLKAQVLTGGRGKAGGILRVDSPDEFEAAAAKLFGMTVKDHAVPVVRVEPDADVWREYYLSLTLSRPRRRILLTVGAQGGVDIEKSGADNLLVQEIALPAGLRPHHVRAAFFHLGAGKELFPEFSALLTRLFDAMLKYGLLLAEINPLAMTSLGNFLALDGKVEMDDNFVDLVPEMNRFFEPKHQTPEENAARSAGMSFVKLRGWVGLMGNGAGLAMATMDALNYSGLSAANFLDLGGTADHQRMRTALDILFGDKTVRAVFINLYGGILSCEAVAEALLAALGGRAPKKPIVARMSGNSAEAGLVLLRSKNIDGLHLTSHMGEALEVLAALKPGDAPVLEFTAPAMESMEPLARPETPAPAPVFPLGIGKDTPILVQGITGKEGRLHTRLMLDYGANVVAGVTPFKGGQEVEGRPVYNSVAEAARRHDIGASIIFVPPKMAADAIMEAASCDIPWAVCITEGIVQHEMLAVLDRLKGSKTRLIGPNTPGIIVPGQTKIGIMPVDPFTPGPVAILSRSGTLTYEAAARLGAAGIGQSVGIGIGGDPFIGSPFTDLFGALREDENTRAVLLLGEIGGTAEEDVARYVAETGFDKPVVAFVAGQTAPPGKRLGHAGAILESKGSGVAGKLATLRAAGIRVAASLDAIAELVAEALG